MRIFSRPKKMHEPRTGCTCTDRQGLGWVLSFQTFVIPNSSCLHPILKGQQNWAYTFTSLLKNFSCFCKHFSPHTHLCFTSTLTLLENGLTGLWMSLVIFPGVNRQEIEKASLNVRKSERYSFTYVRSNSVPYANAYSVPSAYVTTYCILEVLRGQ